MGTRCDCHRAKGVAEGEREKKKAGEIRDIGGGPNHAESRSRDKVLVFILRGISKPVVCG